MTLISERASTKDRNVEKLQRYENAEERRQKARERASKARETHGAKASMVINHIEDMLVDLPDAPMIEFVYNQLDRLAKLMGERDKEIALRAEVNKVRAIENPNVEDLTAGLKVIADTEESGAETMGMNREAVRLKNKAGARLLEERQPAAREKIDAILSDAFMEDGIFITDLLDGASPEKINQAVKRYKAENGGNMGASQLYFKWLVETGVYPNEQEVLIARRSPSGKKKIDAGYLPWMIDRAKESDPQLAEQQEKAEKVGKRIIEAAKEVAGISRRQAANLAGQHVGTGKGLRGAVSQWGWSTKQLDESMVDFMQLAGKMMPRDAKIEVGTAGDLQKATGLRIKGSGRGRAFQTEAGEKGTGRVTRTYVCMAGRNDKRVIYHELGHAIESLNPAVNGMVASWLDKRIAGHKAEPLSKLTGVKSYRRDEVAIKDDFIDPCVGKIYGSKEFGAGNAIRSNEALSMGIERLADPVAAAHFAAKDPDHLALIMAALQVEYQP